MHMAHNYVKPILQEYMIASLIILCQHWHRHAFYKSISRNRSSILRFSCAYFWLLSTVCHPILLPFSAEMHQQLEAGWLWVVMEYVAFHPWVTVLIWATSAASESSYCTI